MKEFFEGVPCPAWLFVAAITATTACGADVSHEQDELSDGALALVVGDGSELATVGWAIFGGALTADMTGTIDVGDEGDEISARIDGIPVSNDYTLELLGTTNVGETCSGSVLFDISAADTLAFVSVVMNCGSAGGGGIAVDGTVNTCPTVGMVVSPIQARVGNTIDLGAAADDADGDPVTFTWSASAGDITAPSAASAVYTCTVAGDVDIQLVADDGHACDVTRTANVACTDDGNSRGDDADGDGVADSEDNCPADANTPQTDTDGNGVGDACDSDDDGDGANDTVDNCPTDVNPGQSDVDGDGDGDVCDTDADGDSVDNDSDNCPLVSNADQADGDGDGVGNACENDIDGDGVLDAEDNCPAEPNADQDDSDGDGVGDACDFVSYQSGHADLAFEFDPLEGEFEVILEAEGSTIDGVDDVDGEFGIAVVQIQTDATFTRPTNDNGFFAPLCVAETEPVFWMPQGNADASSADVPFMGIAAEVDAGLFVGDVLNFELIGVDGPGGTGAYSLWKDGFPPDFRMSSCDGIDASDRTQLSIGHDHFNMGFAGSPGLWTVRYRVSGELVEDGSTPSSEFDVTYDIRD